MTTREEVHQLVQNLPESELQAARRFLEFLRTAGDDALLRALREAPTDDEPTTPEEDAGAEDAWREYQQGKALPWEKVRKELPGD